MIVEYVVGVLADALALQADAFHMASDLLAMIVGYTALNVSRKPSMSPFLCLWRREGL